MRREGVLLCAFHQGIICVMCTAHIYVCCTHSRVLSVGGHINVYSTQKMCAVHVELRRTH